MAYYKVEKTDRLEGEVKIQGSKNSVLPIIAASVMAEDIVSIYNCPDISDVRDIIELLEKLGMIVCFFDNMLYIDGTNAKNVSFDKEEMSKTRGGIILLGALIARFGEARIAYPGGCNIGKRPIDIHLDGISRLNVAISDDDEIVEAYTDKVVGSEITLKFPSVGATENLMMLATKAKGVTKIYNAAKEPEIIDLQDFLNKLGANITGAGTDCIIIKGVDKLKGGSYKVIGDRMVAATYMAATAAVGGKVKLKNVCHEYLKEEISYLRKMGCYVKCRKDYILVARDVKKKLRSVLNLETGPYPEFATDAGACFVAALLMADGISVLRENIFDDRYKVVNEMNRLGAMATVINGKIVVICGSEYLVGEKVYATDLRGGAALVVAGLMSLGTTQVHNIHYIIRGYENIVRDLKCIGANITEEI